LFLQVRGAKSALTFNFKEKRIVKYKSICQLACAATLFVGLFGPAMAQDTTTDQTQAQTPPPPANLGPRKAAPAQVDPNAPKVETVATHNGWVVQCSDIPAQNGQPAGKSCGMTQTGKNEKAEGIGLSLIINRGKAPGGKKQTIMRALVPVGVYLPTGVAMEIDGTALEGRMSFTRCNPRACEAFGEPSDATMKKFLKGKQATFYIYDRPGNGYPIKFALSGFAEGVADLDKQ
jgi:invasion protein IalB